MKMKIQKSFNIYNEIKILRKFQAIDEGPGLMTFDEESPSILKSINPCGLNAELRALIFQNQGTFLYALPLKRSR